MSAPISNTSTLIYTEQEQPKCTVCDANKVLFMRFFAMYGTSYQFCSNVCLNSWIFSKSASHLSCGITPKKPV